MNALEQYIQPGWTSRPLTVEEATHFCDPDDWLYVDCDVNHYGNITSGLNYWWVMLEWEMAVTNSYYMA
jgi:hypothetical protein